MIRIGANPIGWSNDDMLEIGGDIPLETCLKRGARGRLRRHGARQQVPARGRQAQADPRKHGHALVGGWYSTELLARSVEDELKAAKAHATLLRGDGLLGLHRRRDLERDPFRHASCRSRRGRCCARKAWKQFGERYTNFAEAIKDEYGLQLVYHHHMGTVVQTEAEIDRFMEVTGEAVHLLLDTGHATWGGGDPARIARHYKARISHVHCKDIREEVMWQLEPRGLVLPRFRARRRLHRAGRRHDRLCPRAQGAARAIPAGSWSRPSRIRRRPSRRNMPSSATTICTGS